MIHISRAHVRIDGSDEEIQKDLEILGKALRDMGLEELKEKTAIRWTMDKVEEKVRLLGVTSELMSMSPDELERIKKEMEEGEHVVQ